MNDPQKPSGGTAAVSMTLALLAFFISTLTLGIQIGIHFLGCAHP